MDFNINYSNKDSNIILIVNIPTKNLIINILIKTLIINNLIMDIGNCFTNSVYIDYYLCWKN